jgi:hypothetical protein
MMYGKYRCPVGSAFANMQNKWCIGNDGDMKIRDPQEGEDFYYL